MRYSIVRHLAVFGLFLLTFFGCNKSNHNTLVPLGDESYMVGVDEIYPKDYRMQWPVVADPGYYHISGGELQPPLNEYVFPPNLMGEFVVNGVRKGGNETWHNSQQPDSSLYYHNPIYDNMSIDIKITDQKNGFANIYVREYNSYVPNNPPMETENVYIYGDGANGNFTICFEAPYNQNLFTYYYAYIMTGTFDSIVGPESTVYGMKNVRFWQLIKDREGVTGTVMPYLNIGGQRLYVADFAERVKTIEELENE